MRRLRFRLGVPEFVPGALLLLVALSTLSCRHAAAPASQAPEESVQVARQSPEAATEVDVPTVGGDGVDPWGVPVRTADKTAIRKLLQERRFSDLTRALERLEAAAERNCLHERPVADAFGVFDSTDPSLEPLLDAWVDASPGSFAPLVGRGVYWTTMGAERRGGAWASETTARQWEAMEEAHARARTDLLRSVELRPTITAYRGLMTLGSYGSSDTSGYFEAGRRICPQSLMLHVRFIRFMTPRWGGSYDVMLAFADSAPVDRNPALKVLPGFVNLDRARRARGDNRLEEALAENEKALAHGPHWEFLHDKALTLSRLRRHKEALAAIDQVIAQRPQEAVVHEVRAKVLNSLGMPAEAAEAFLYARHINPAHDFQRGLDSNIVLSLLRAAQQHYADPGVARRLVEQALLVKPQDPGARWAAAQRGIQAVAPPPETAAALAPPAGPPPPLADAPRSPRWGDEITITSVAVPPNANVAAVHVEGGEFDVPEGGYAVPLRYSRFFSSEDKEPAEQGRAYLLLRGERRATQIAVARREPIGSGRYQLGVRGAAGSWATLTYRLDQRPPLQGQANRSVGKVRLHWAAGQPVEAQAVLPLVSAEFPGLGISLAMPLELPSQVFNRGGQVRADALLAGAKLGPGSVAVVLEDLSTRDEDFVLARTHDAAGTAVVSTSRLRTRDGSPAIPASRPPGETAAPSEVVTRRIAKELVGTIGRLIGMTPGCFEPRCVFSATETMEAYDRKGGGFCPAHRYERDRILHEILEPSR